MKLDDIDKRILRALQRDGRMANNDLAREVGLSPSPCLRRVKLLEERGSSTATSPCSIRPRSARGRLFSPGYG